MPNYKYDNPDIAYEEAQRHIRAALHRPDFRSYRPVLDLNNFGLTTVPPEIGNLAGLTFLRLDENKLTDVPPEIRNLTELTMLDLSGNQLTAVPPEIGQLTALTELYLHNNQLTAVPPEIGQLTGLKELELGGNELTAVPPEIGQLIQLTQLYLYENQLTAVPPEIGQLTGLTVLNLHGNKLTAVPPGIGQLTGLTTLYLHENKLTAVPPEIGRLTGLTVLNLGRNQLIAVPPEIGQLTALTELLLNGNKLTAVPPEIWQLTALTDIRLGMNQLTTIPPEIGQLTGLTRLSLGIYNDQLNDDLKWLDQLAVGNKLATIPLEIKQLTELTSLDLSGNQLTTVPPEITQLTKLEYLDLEYNPDLPIPPEITSQWSNPQAILDYIRENQEAPSSPLNEAKLILVGQGGVGKTSLVKRLLHNEFDEAENQTKGINIEKWSLPVNRPSQGTVPISLNIWDFGGQEIMHATHQFFLTKRSLYLLVLDARAGEEEGRVEYWLALINSFAPAAPVLIIINKSDQHHLDINRRGLQEKYPAIVGFVSTSASSGKGIGLLQRKIAATLANMEHVDTPFPASWMRVKTALVAMQSDHNYIPYADYQALCQRSGVDKESSQTTLVRFLHDLGIILNFNDDERISETSVLNPNWVTEGIYTLLNTPSLQEQRGILRRAQLRDILSQDLYPTAQQRRFLLEMMLKFELAFELDDRQTLLIPDLIGKEQPAFNWNDGDALQFAYQYSVLPLSVLHRFMVRQHHLIDPDIRWRTGVLLKQNNLTALIKADIKKATITVSIRGDGKRRHFLYTIRSTFAGIHEPIAGTNPKEVVPIPAHPAAAPIGYAYLEELEEMGMQALPFPDKNGKVLMLNVQELLDGVSTSAMRQTPLQTRKQIVANLIANFNDDEFYELLFELGVDRNDLEGKTVNAQKRDCVAYLERRNKLVELVVIMGRKRPFASFIL